MINKQSQVNVLKAELCILFMMCTLKPQVTIAETICRAIKANAIILEIAKTLTQPTPSFKKGLAAVGENTKNESIIN